jgi:D-alanyl-D-alanine carboxypeptidase
MKFKSICNAAMFIGALVCFTACQKTNTPDDILSGQKEFDVDLFENNLKSGMGDQWVGYSYIISKNGQYERGGYFGKRRTGTDGNINSSHVVPYYAASINKTISAVAMLKVLQDKNNGDADGFLNAKIAQFLPPNWTFGANAANISFRDLLEHKSGISASAATDYSGLRTLIGSGTSAQKTYQYSNANYALIRILVARMSGNTGTDNLQNDVAMSDAVLKGFRRYVDTQLFEPINIEADTKDNSISSTLYYKFGSNEPGWKMGEMEERLGSGGYFLSAKDIASFLAYLNHTETLISKANRKTSPQVTMDAITSKAVPCAKMPPEAIVMVKGYEISSALSLSMMLK